VQYLFWLREQVRAAGWRHALHASAAHPELRGAALAGCLWCAYVAGAISGGFSKGRWELYALALPLGALAVVIAVELARPSWKTA
jgi:hypothetical protein